MCVLISSTTFVWNISRAKYPLFLSDFNETRIFWTIFRKLLKYKISWKSFQWESSCFMRTDGRTWRCQWSLFAILRTRVKNVIFHISNVKILYAVLRHLSFCHFFKNIWSCSWANSDLVPLCMSLCSVYENSDLWHTCVNTILNIQVT